MGHSLSDFTIHQVQAPKSAAVLKAMEFDAQGNHNMALEILKQASHHNDAEAVVQLGKRLLFGDRAPQLFQEGINLIQAAAKLGSGEAWAQAASLYATGIFPQSWSRAIECLVQAATANWLPAQGQLIALCSNKDLRTSALTEKHDAKTWLELAQHIELNLWLTPAIKTTLSETPEIKIMSDFIPPSVCEWLIELGRPKLGRARVYDSENSREIENETRTNRSADLTLMMSDVATLLVQAHISATIDAPVSHMETLSILHYRSGEQITPHYDFINPKRAGFSEEVAQMGQRRITFLIYLNEDYEGGETGFPKLGLSNKGRAGDAIYFVNIEKDSAPNLDTQHTGNPPRNGEKWLATQFVREKQVINFAI